jgi:hypothetical protein
MVSAEFSKFGLTQVELLLFFVFICLAIIRLFELIGSVIDLTMQRCVKFVRAKFMQKTKLDGKYD